MTAALAAEGVLAADETPVNVLDKSPLPAPAPEEAAEADPEEKDATAAAGAPHVLIVRTPDGRLTFLQAIGSRRKGSVGGGIPAAFTGHLITDGYTGYQHLLSRIAGIQQCAQHVIRRCRAVMKPGPGGVQNWAGDIIAVLGQAHRAVEDARARGSTELDQQVLGNLRERYDQAAGVRAHPQPAPGLGHREPPRLRTRLLAARLQGTGLPVHPRLRRELDERGGFRLHLLGAFCSIEAFAVVSSLRVQYGVGYRHSGAVGRRGWGGSCVLSGGCCRGLCRCLGLGGGGAGLAGVVEAGAAVVGQVPGDQAQPVPAFDAGGVGASSPAISSRVSRPASRSRWWWLRAGSGRSGRGGGLREGVAFPAGDAPLGEDPGDLAVGVLVEQLVDEVDGGLRGLALLPGVQRERQVQRVVLAAARSGRAR